jgi:pimeloyl-ACP methyl ester carboxylesterase
MVARFAHFLTPRWEIGLVLRRLVYGDGSRVTERDVDEYWAPARDPAWVMALRATVEEFDWAPIPVDELAGLRAPTLVVLGTADRITRGVSLAARAIPRVRIETLPGGHGVNEEYADAVCDLMIDFLRQHQDASPSVD